MKIADYRGYELHVPTSGGKAGKGCNVTTTCQIRLDGYIKKQFRFSTVKTGAGKTAAQKARAWVDAELNKLTIT